MSDEINLQDLFVIGADGKVYLLREETYLSQPPLTHGYATSLLLAYNTIGQVLTKVVKKNIENMSSDKAASEDAPLASNLAALEDATAPVRYEPGYWFDLRLLRLASKLAVPDIPVNNRPVCPKPPYTIDVSEDVPENLFLVYWEHPEEPTNNEYTIRYIPQDVVLKSEAPASDSEAILQYFVKSGSQTGVLTDKERCYLGMHGACYIANLSSFRRR